jgi:hypothetical protein
MGAIEETAPQEPQLSYEFDEDSLNIRVTVRRVRRLMGEQRPRHKRPWEMNVAVTATIPLTDGTADFTEADATAQGHLKVLVAALNKLMNERGYLADS